MKKIITFTLMFILLSTLVACSDNENNEKETLKKTETKNDETNVTTTEGVIISSEEQTTNQKENTTERKKKKDEMHWCFTNYPEYQYVLNYTDIIEKEFSEVILNPGESIDCKAKIKELGYNEDYYDFFSFMYTNLCYSSVRGVLNTNESAVRDNISLLYYLDAYHELIITNPTEYPITWRVTIEGDTIYFRSEW